MSVFKRFERVIRYIAVGGGVTLFYSALTIGFIKGGIISDPTFASGTSFVLTQPLSFLAHRRFTYADAGEDMRQWQRFGVIALTGFAITIGVMQFVMLLKWPYQIGLIVGWVLIPIANFLINAFWVFRTKKLLMLDRPQDLG